MGGADLSFADLKYADLCFTVLDDVNLTEADVSGMSIGETLFTYIDLSATKGLEEVQHILPSSLTIDTLFLSKGKIPDIFLRGCGVPESLIEHLPSFLNNPLDFYTCFISFTEANDVFAERLYNDLQARGVRCWRWKEDAKIGKTLMGSIDEAVKVYDKLIVICSEDSLKSPAVIREIERALQKEDNRIRDGKEGEVLFPIRLDDYIFSDWDHYRMPDVVQKNVGDFRNWHDPVGYKKSLDRLIRDLRAE